tara:strand:- start:108 stop:1481 length:1374 start_codon:yes stop_codon:yes gene_type:complete
MINSDTIIALATPPGIGAISIIRISGKNAISVSEKLFFKKNKKKLSSHKSHTVHLGKIKNNENEIDEVLLTIFKTPHSYTGENTIEISCHGSIYIQQQIIDLYVQNGARVADPGEFTLRAFLNGKMDLNQAEAVADLISSENEGAHRLAIQQMKKEFSSDIKKLRKELLDFVSLIELELDFSEEDVEFADRNKFNSLIKKIKLELKLLIDSFKSGNVLKNGVSVAIVGKPNAGKSSLMNALAKDNKAIVSDIPGTTRDSIETSINIKGVKFRFIDTAGLRKTNDVIESKGIEKTREQISKANILIYLFDINDIDESEIKKTLSDFDREDLTVLLVRNKIDLKTKKTELLNNIRKMEIIEISALETSSVDLIKNKLISNINIINTHTNTVISNSRHLNALNNALNSLIDVETGIENNLSSDLLSIDIRKCIDSIGEITGEVTNDDILGNIFANFCIGK